jgi:tetratricopeptide (TPR) repeat protein
MVEAAHRCRNSVARALTRHALVFASLLAWAPAFGAGQNDYDECMQHADQDRTIAGCTHIIEDIGESNRNRRIAYDNRGTAWRDKGDRERALADYGEAIRLNPNNALAYNNRGNVQHEKGDNKRAIADYNEAIRLDPKDAIAYCNRGKARHATGDDARAAADYTEATRLDPEIRCR